MKSTVKTNSRLTYGIVSENRVVADAWNRQQKQSHGGCLELSTQTKSLSTQKSLAKAASLLI
jgi:hypothetical protein